MKMNLKNKIIVSILGIGLLFITGCSSVFSAGVSGKLVDKASTKNPKAGIHDVEVYAYVDEKNRDADYDAYSGSGRFSPKDDKYFIGHTTTNEDGNFTINKVTWEEFFPDFGKTADYCTIYLLFYHDDYGLVKNSNPAIIMSDSTSNVVYQELTKTKTTTELNINVRDAGTEKLIEEPVIVNINVEGGQNYEDTITGNGKIKISYKINTTPNVTISVRQPGTNKKWKQCNFDKANENYKFLAAEEKYTIKAEGESMPADVYVKSTVLNVPSINGQLGDGKSDTNDNKKIFLAYKKDGVLTQFDTASSEVTTEVVVLNDSNLLHGKFSGLGNGATWTDETYEGKYATKEVFINVNSLGETNKFTIRSDKSTYNVGIIN